MVTLDNQERKLEPGDVVIADGKKAIGLAGVMGGLNSEVTEKTTTVVLEAAVFDRTSIRKTAQRLALRSEASNRFEKGIPLELPEIAIERAAKLLTEIPGGLAGEIPVVKPKAGENVDVLNGVIYPKYVGFSLKKLNQFLGVEITPDEAIKILSSLGFKAEKFDFKKEARSHVGKPYVFGAKYTTHGDMAFDCSYLTDFIYRKLGQFIGHTALAQFELGLAVEVEDLRPGDLVFYEGVDVKKEWQDHYYIPDGKGNHKKVKVSPPKAVGHVGIYIGNDRVIHAHMYVYDSKKEKWIKLPQGKAKVEEVSLSVFTENPTYLGARRFVNENDLIFVTAPWWRLDVTITEDIFEEIGRIYGYENLPATLPSGKLPQFEENKSQKMVAEIKALLSGTGFDEVINYSFISAKQLTMVGEELKNTLRVANPLTPENEYMRTSLAPSLVEDVRVNQDNYNEVTIYEIASTYIPKKDLASEATILGIAFKTKGKKSAEVFFAIKGVLELLAQRLNLGKLSVKKSTKPYLAVGQTASVFIDGIEVGYLGMSSEKLTHEADLKSPVAVAEIDLFKLLKLFGKEREYEPVSKYPAVIRDVNLLFEKKVTAENIEMALTETVNGVVKKSFITDIFEGADLPAGFKSVTIRIVLASAEKTLTEDEVTVSLNKVITGLTKIGGKFRR